MHTELQTIQAAREMLEKLNRENSVQRVALDLSRDALRRFMEGEEVSEQEHRTLLDLLDVILSGNVDASGTPRIRRKPAVAMGAPDTERK